jgi:hypothetical protein
MDHKTDLSPESLDKGEKAEFEYGLELPRGQLATLENGAAQGVIELSKEEETRILRKVDYRLVPILAFLYLVAFVDRSNSRSIFVEYLFA